MLEIEDTELSKTNQCRQDRQVINCNKWNQLIILAAASEYPREGAASSGEKT